MRAISAPTSAARFSKFSGQCSAHICELFVVSFESIEMLPALARRLQNRSNAARASAL